MTSPLKVISIQSKNADSVCHEISDYLGAQLGIATEFVDGVSWQERDAMLNGGEAHIGWVCGLPYLRKLRAGVPIELMVAPVMAGRRYRNRPIYYSDVIVYRDSPYQQFTDLRGRRWAYNEPNSQSGYNITRYHLARMGERNHFFGQVIEAGSHLNAMGMVLDRQITASAIDSTVLEIELESRPELYSELRIIESLGPSPIPPWVVSTDLPQDLRDAIRTTLQQMHRTRAGQDILRRGQITRLAAVTHSDYDVIAKMEECARTVRW